MLLPQWTHLKQFCLRLFYLNLLEWFKIVELIIINKSVHELEQKQEGESNKKPTFKIVHLCLGDRIDGSFIRQQWFGICCSTLSTHLTGFLLPALELNLYFFKKLKIKKIMNLNQLFERASPTPLSRSIFHLLSYSHFQGQQISLCSISVPSLAQVMQGWRWHPLNYHLLPLFSLT